MAYSKVVQAFVDAWGSVTGFFAENQFENVDWSTFQRFSRANADLHDRGPNAQRGLLKRFRYVTQAEVLANGNEGDALENLDYDSCCVGTHIIVQYYQPDPLVPATRDQLLVAAYDPSPDAKFVYSDGSFRTGDRSAPAKFVPVSSPQGQYGYVRRDTVPPSINDWRVDELSIWELSGVDEFATAKQAGGPWPAFTGVDDAYWKPAAPPTLPTGGGSGTVKSVNGQAPDAAGDVQVATSAPVTVDGTSIVVNANGELAAVAETFLIVKFPIGGGQTQTIDILHPAQVGVLGLTQASTGVGVYGTFVTNVQFPSGGFRVALGDVVRVEATVGPSGGVAVYQRIGL